MKNTLLLLLAIGSLSVESQTWNQLQKIVPEDREVNDEYGNAVAISGDYAIVGAMREHDDGNGQNSAPDAGSAYLFDNGTTATEEITIQRFLAYPNPATNMIYIKLEDSQYSELSILDAQGRLVLKDILNDLISEVDISDLGDGVYMLLVRTENEFLEAKRVIVY